MIFRIRRYRYCFQAVDRVVFPPAAAGNTLRGALGHILQAAGSGEAMFPRRMEAGPSGLSDPPRPFVLRAAHLDGQILEPGDTFWIGVHEFAVGRPAAALLEKAFGAFGHTGIGAERGRALLLPGERGGDVEQIELSAAACSQHAVVRFVTPTELKGDSPPGEVPFGLLFARSRDRVATLSRLYGEELLAPDFAAMGERASRVRTVRSTLAYQRVDRRSSRTGQTHGIGGFSGSAEYAGELGEFLPWLRAAAWTGVGRHTVWGNGVIEIDSAE